MDPKLLDDLVRRVSELERTRAFVRVGIVENEDPASVQLGGSSDDSDVSALSDAAAEAGDRVAVLQSGKDAIALGRVTDTLGGIKITQASGSTSAPTTTSTAAPGSLTAVVPEMTITQNTGGNRVLVLFHSPFQHSADGGRCTMELYIDSVYQGAGARSQGNASGANQGNQMAIAKTAVPSAASHTFEIRWGTSAGTLTALDTSRQMILIEFRDLL